MFLIQSPSNVIFCTYCSVGLIEIVPDVKGLDELIRKQMNETERRMPPPVQM